MLTMIDCKSFFANLKTLEQLKDRGESAGPDDERNVADLLMDQVEFANVIVLNKVNSICLRFSPQTDLVTPDELAKVSALVHKLNPSAKLLTTTYSNVDLSSVLNTGLFNFEQAALGNQYIYIPNPQSTWMAQRVTWRTCSRNCGIQYRELCVPRPQTFPPSTLS